MTLSEERRVISDVAFLLRGHGIDISAPWDGDLDDLERERFAAIVQACRMYRAEMNEIT